MRQGTRIGLATALASAFAAAVAAAAIAAPGDTTYTGETAEGVAVKLTVASPGNATKFKLAKSKVECDQGGTLSNEPGTYTRFDTSDPGAFNDKRSTESDSGNYHFKTRSTLAGILADSGDAWSGTLKLSTKVYKRSNQIDACKLKTTWDAS